MKRIDGFGNQEFYLTISKHKRLIFRKIDGRWRYDGWYDQNLEEIC